MTSSLAFIQLSQLLHSDIWFILDIEIVIDLIFHSMYKIFYRYISYKSQTCIYFS